MYKVLLAFASLIPTTPTAIWSRVHFWSKSYAARIASTGGNAAALPAGMEPEMRQTAILTARDTPIHPHRSVISIYAKYTDEFPLLSHHIWVPVL